MSEQYVLKYIDLLIFIVFALFEGWREAAKDAHGGSNTNYPYNVHLYYLPIRVLVSIVCVSFNFLSIKSALLLLLSYALVFPFWHDGAYYVTRKALEPHNPLLMDYHWFGESSTTTAKISLSAPGRVLFFTIGLIIYAGYEFWQYLVLVDI